MDHERTMDPIIRSVRDRTKALKEVSRQAQAPHPCGCNPTADMHSEGINLGGLDVDRMTRPAVASKAVIGWDVLHGEWPMREFQVISKRVD